MDKKRNLLFDEEIRALMSVPDMEPEFDAQLEERLREKLHKMEEQRAWHTERKLRLSFAAVGTSVIVLMMAAVLAIGPQKVWAAVRSLGFLPGIGYVQDDVRVLDEPVMIQRGESNAVLSSLVSDSENTWLRVVITGTNKYSSAVGDQCLLSPKLIYGNGSAISPNWSATTVKTDEVILEIGFAVLPIDVDKAALALSCLPGVPAEDNQAGWQFEFGLRLPAENEQPYPAETLSATSGRGGGSTSLAESSAQDEGVNLVVDNVVELADGYQFRGTVVSQDDTAIDFHSDSIGLQTLDGRTIELQTVDIPFGADFPAGINSWVLRTNTKDLPAQLIFTVKELAFKRSDETVQAQRVSFSLGENPQPGQTWPIDQTIQVAGIDVKFHEVTLEKAAEDVYLLMFWVEYPQENIYEMTLADTDNPVAEMNGGSGGGGGGGGNNPNLRLESIAYNSVPSGERTIYVTDAYIVQSGDWSTTIQLPE
jgi:hypothetical protein